MGRLPHRPARTTRKHRFVPTGQYSCALSWRIHLSYHSWRWEDQVRRRARRHHRTMTEWMDKAACRHVNAELFFPVGSGPATARQVARAKAVCSCCPVTERCLTWAMHSGEIDGIWGGLDGDERRALKRKAQLTPASM